MYYIIPNMVKNEMAVVNNFPFDLSYIPPPPPPSSRHEFSVINACVALDDTKKGV